MFRDPTVVVSSVILEVVCVIEFTEEVFDLTLDKFELFLSILRQVFVNSALTRLVDFRSGLFACERDVAFNASVLECLHVEDKFHQTGDSLLRLHRDVFEPDDMDWDFRS